MNNTDFSYKKSTNLPSWRIACTALLAMLVSCLGIIAVCKNGLPYATPSTNSLPRTGKGDCA